MTIMNRSEVLESLRTLLMMMQCQVKQVGSPSFTYDFFWRVDSAFNKKIDLYYSFSVLTDSDYVDLLNLRQVILDEMEVARRDQFPEKRVLFISSAYRNAPKDAQGYPLQPVQLCDLLVEDIFKDLPAIGESGQESDQLPDAVQVNANASKGLSNCAGSIEPVISLVGRELIKRGFFTVESWIAYQEQKYYLKMRPF